MGGRCAGSIKSRKVVQVQVKQESNYSLGSVEVADDAANKERRRPKVTLTWGWFHWRPETGRAGTSG